MIYNGLMRIGWVVVGAIFLYSSDWVNVELPILTSRPPNAKRYLHLPTYFVGFAILGRTL